jgi:SAM-dependent methyltransferase
VQADARIAACGDRFAGVRSATRIIDHDELPGVVILRDDAVDRSAQKGAAPVKRDRYGDRVAHPASMRARGAQRPATPGAHEEPGVDRPPSDTRSSQYTRRLAELQATGWRRWLDVQAPYRRHLRKLSLGFTLDVGCGIGRTLAHCDGDGVGVDHNADSVALACAQGFEAYLDTDFWDGPRAVEKSFDSLLFSHVLEHMRHTDAAALVRKYLPLLRPGGRAVFLCPQEAGYRSDPSHVFFADFTALEAISSELGLLTERAYSFPFPRPVGRIFAYNEFVVVARKPAAIQGMGPSRS